jgi:hypothetical protein
LEIWLAASTPRRPRRLRYSLTLHGPDGRRLVGFDNAHAVPPLGSVFREQDAAHDHWHRWGRDPRRPYKFTDAAQPLTDFEKEVERVLAELGAGSDVIDDIGQF